MATLNQLQKWGWLLFAMALLIPVLCTMHKPPTYIPKLQCSPFKQLMGQWGQVLKSWVKKASKDIESWKETWQWWQVIHCNHAIAQKHSAHHIHMQPQAILALQVLALTAMGARQPKWVSFDTDSHSIGIDNCCSACISHNIANFVDTPRPISRLIKGFGGNVHRMSKLAPYNGIGRTIKAWFMTTPSRTHITSPMAKCGYYHCSTGCRRL